MTKSAKRKRAKPNANIVIELPGSRSAQIIRETDPDGRIVAHPRTVDAMDRMLKAGTITAAMFNAARDFHSRFTTATLNTMPSVSLDGPSGGNGSLSDRQLDARRNINNALDRLGGPSSQSGSCVWHVVGCETSIREWTRRRKWNGKAIHKNTARGVLVAALEVLAVHYGYANEIPNKMMEA